MYNGAPDGRDGLTSNPDNDFELVGRLFFEPWKNAANGLSGLGFGIAGSTGDKEGLGNNYLPRYRTPGQVQFFGYRSESLPTGNTPAGPRRPISITAIRAPGRIHLLLPAPLLPVQRR